MCLPSSSVFILLDPRRPRSPTEEEKSFKKLNLIPVLKRLEDLELGSEGTSDSFSLAMSVGSSRRPSFSVPVDAPGVSVVYKPRTPIMHLVQVCLLEEGGRMLDQEMSGER